MPPETLQLEDGDVVARALATDDATHAFEVVWEGEAVGRVELLTTEGGDGDLIWVVVPEYRAVAVVERALRLVVDWAVSPRDSVPTSPQLQRVEARVAAEDRDSVRAALRAGLRREGVERSALVGPGHRTDVVVLARVAS